MKISTLARNACVNAVTSLIDGGTAEGYLELRTGSAPANVSDPDSGTLLATCLMSDPSFPLATGGTASAHAIGSDVEVDASGTAGHFRVKDSSGAVVLQGSCGENGSTADMILNTISLTAGGTVSITSFSLTMVGGS